MTAMTDKADGGAVAEAILPKPQMLTVIILNTTETYLRLVHENEYVPYGRRTVHIPLTPEQMEMLRLKYTGRHDGSDRHEVIGEVWLERTRGSEAGDE